MKSSSFSIKLLLLLGILMPLEAVLIKRTFVVSYFPGSPDGVHKEKVLGIDGQFPGPTIQAFVGDSLEVTILNKIQDKQNLTIHWHGMHQRGTWFEDGTNQISQCPLPYGSFQVYRFNLTHAGTYWYHSHVRSQYTEGLLGALIVHNHEEPYRYDYDGEITLMLTDWYHRTAHENEEWYLSPVSGGKQPYPDSTLINGYGRYPCNFASLQNRSCSTESQNREVFTIPHNSTFRVRIINGGALAFFNFSIDGHRLETIEVDGIDVLPSRPVDVASIGPGQRYSFLIRPPTSSNSHQSEGRFLMRSAVRKEFFQNSTGNINPYPEALYNEVTSVLYRSKEDLPSDFIDISIESFTHKEELPAREEHDGTIHLDDMDLFPMDGIPTPDHFDVEHILVSTSVQDEHGVFRASFNGTPFTLPDNKPLLFSLIEDGYLPPSAMPVEVGYNNVVQIVLNNPFGVHPFHLHGHHFWVVGLGKSQDGDYDSLKHNLTIRAPLRDTVVVEQNSYAVIRFVADNPGVWTLHCHLDWHNLGGMAFTIVEAPELVKQHIRPTEEAIRICKLHK